MSYIKPALLETSGPERTGLQDAGLHYPLDTRVPVERGAHMGLQRRNIPQFNLAG